MSSKVAKLVTAYRQHLTVPWQTGLAAIQRVKHHGAFCGGLDHDLTLIIPLHRRSGERCLVQNGNLGWLGKCCDGKETEDEETGNGHGEV